MHIAHTSIIYIYIYIYAINMHDAYIKYYSPICRPQGWQRTSCCTSGPSCFQQDAKVGTLVHTWLARHQLVPTTSYHFPQCNPKNIWVPLFFIFYVFWDLRCQRPSSRRYWTFRENILEILQKYISQLSPEVVQKWEGLTCEGVHGTCLGTAATATC